MKNTARHGTKPISSEAATAAGGTPAKSAEAGATAAPHQPFGGNIVWVRDYLALLGLVVAASFVVFHEFLLFQKTYLFKDVGSDSINIFYPHVALLLDYLRDVGFPSWSFRQGMGQNVFVGTGDPLLLLFYAFGRNNIGFAIAYAEVVKIALGSSFFFFYLRKLGLTPFACIVGGLLYAFTGYMIVGGQWYLCSWEAMCCALLLLAFEKLYQDGNWKLFPIPIALFAAYQPFDLFLYGELLLVYATVRFLERERWSLRRYAQLLGKLVLFGTIGVAIGGFIFFENVQALVMSPRVGGQAGYFQDLLSQSLLAFASPQEYISIVLRLFATDLQGTGSGFEGWNNYFEAPMLYCGLLTLLFVPQFFAFADARKRRIYFALAALLLLALVFPYARFVIWAFSGNYYRTFGFFIAFALLFFGLRGLSFVDQSETVNRRTLAITLAVLVGVLVGTASVASSVNSNLLVLIVAALLFYGGAAFALSMRHNRRLWHVATIAMVCIELVYFSRMSIAGRPVIAAAELTQHVGYNDYTVDAVRYLHSTDRGFYRFQKNYRSGLQDYGSLNDSKAQGYYGTSSYSPFNQKNYIAFLRGMGVIEGNDEGPTRWATGLNRTVLWILGSVKYFLIKPPPDNLESSGYHLAASAGDVRIFQNDYFLPLGFAYDAYVPASEFSKLTTVQKDQVLLKAVVVDDEEQRRFASLKRLDVSRLSEEYSVPAFLEDYGARKSATLKIAERGENSIRGAIELEKPALLFFSIPFDVGWSVLVDGRPATLDKVDFGMTGILLDKGAHDVKLDFRPRLLKLGIVVSAIGIAVYLTLLAWSHLRRRKAAAP